MSESVLKHVWTEPRSVAEIEWFCEHPDPFAQIMEQVGRGAMEHYVATGEHLPGVAEQEVSVVIHEPPDWDWWEPTSRWRRLDARDREWREGDTPAEGTAQ